RLTVDRAEFQEVLGRAAILTNDKFRGVRLTLGANRMVVSANNPEQEEASDEMSIEYGGPDLEIGFNVNYLMDALKVLPKEHVELAVEDSNSSCTLQTPGDEKSQYLVMPMRL
ncbi:MAG: DNA polymerase III subunit beta, partial [Gammaproteobacteria bacterium]|nr:DNA polymerase III subunit beta [Gammaproteobacteria bacterium]